MNDEESPFFLYVYEGLAATSPFGTFGLGEPWHMKDVFAWAKAQLLGAGEGDDVKSPRWFSFEKRSRLSHSARYLDILALMWLGWRRQWWKKFSDSPMFSQKALVAPDNSEPLAGEKALLQAGEEDDEAHEKAGAEASAVGDDTAQGASSAAAALKEVHRRRSACVNLLKFALPALLKPVSVRLWAVLSWAHNRWISSSWSASAGSRPGMARLRSGST